jgi:ABC-type multidrug transport system fused ATPase/permease subunit
MVFSAIKEAWNFVDRPLKKLFRILLLVRIITNFFDLLGSVFLAIMVGYLVGALSGNSQTSTIKNIVDLLNLGGISLNNQIIFLGLITLAIFALRPIVVIPISRILIHRIHKHGATLTIDFVSKFTNLQLSSVRMKSSSEINYVLSEGIPLVLRLLWIAVTLISDAFLIIMFLSILFVSSPITTLGLIAYILFLFGLLAWINGSKLYEAGTQSATTTANTTKKILEILSMFREIYVTNRINYQISKLKEDRILQGKTIATVEWISQIPRYVIDFALVFGIVIVAIGQAGSESLASVATTTSLFLTAAIRILPTISPMQNSINNIKNRQGQTRRVHDLAKFINDKSIKRDLYLNSLKRPQHQSVDYNIKVSNLSLMYSNTAHPAIENISFEIKSGSTLAIIGSSGSGKTTLADCLLGLLEPTSGSVEIDKTAPEIYRTINTGSISYVSQDVALIDGSIRENVAFAMPESEIDVNKIKIALKRAHIYDFVKLLPEGLETVVGERGTRLSGGQRQRIGIARALYSSPKILILDEATSALDAETESAITEMLKELHGQVTIISIAHRLSTVMHSDLVLFLRNGKLAGSGKFEDLVKQHPDLAHQAELLGIDIDAL